MENTNTTFTVVHKIYEFLMDENFFAYLSGKEIPNKGVKKRIKVMPTGRMVGKSTTAANTILPLMLEYKFNILILRDFKSDIKDSIYNSIVQVIRLNKLEERFHITKESITTYSDDKSILSEISFGGYERNIDSVRGKDRFDLYILEDAHRLTMGELDTMIPSFIRWENSQIWIFFNPINANDDIVKLYVTKKYGHYYDDITEVMTLTYKDNPFLPDSVTKPIDIMKEQNYDKWKYIYGGTPLPAMENAIFEKEVNDVYKEHRVCNVRHRTDLPVVCSFDLARSGYMAIIFYQELYNQINVIDFIMSRNHSHNYYFNEMLKRPYQYSYFVLPHDSTAGDGSDDGSFMAKCQRFFPNTIMQPLDGRGYINRLPKPKITEYIDALRDIMPIMVFDKDNCEQLLEHLGNYHYDKLRAGETYSKEPVKDIHSHASEAVCYYAFYRTLSVSMPTPENRVSDNVNEIHMDTSIPQYRL